MPASFNFHHRVSGDPTRSRSSHFIKTRWRRINHPRLGGFQPPKLFPGIRPSDVPGKVFAQAGARGRARRLTKISLALPLGV